MRPFLARHRHDERSQDVVKAPEVGVHHVVPVFVRHRGQRHVAVDARVQNNAPEGAAFGHIRREHLGRGLAVGDVKGKGIGLVPEGAKVFRGLLGAFGVATVDGNDVAFFGEALRDGKADPAGAPGHEDATAGTRPRRSGGDGRGFGGSGNGIAGGGRFGHGCT